MNTQEQINAIHCELKCIRGLLTRCLTQVAERIDELTRAAVAQERAHDEYRKSLVDLTAQIISRAADKDPIEPSNN